MGACVVYQTSKTRQPSTNVHAGTIQAMHSFMSMCLCVHANALLTCGVALHVNDAFGVHAHLPGIEGTNTNSDFHRSPRHGCSFGLLPCKNPCIFLLNKNKF